jgi:hypothetical protein
MSNTIKSSFSYMTSFANISSTYWNALANIFQYFTLPHILRWSPLDSINCERTLPDSSGLQFVTRMSPTGVRWSLAESSNSDGVRWSPVTLMESAGLQQTPADSSGLRQTPVDSSRLQWTPADSSGLQQTPADSSGLQWTPADSGKLHFILCSETPVIH